MESDGVFGSQLRELQRALPGESIQGAEAHASFDSLQLPSTLNSQDAISVLQQQLTSQGQLPRPLRSSSVVVLEALQLGLRTQNLPASPVHLFVSLVTWIERSVQAHLNPDIAATFGEGSAAKPAGSAKAKKGVVRLSLEERLEQLQEAENAFAAEFASRPDEMRDLEAEPQRDSESEANRMAASVFLLRSITGHIPSKVVTQYFEKISTLTLSVLRIYYDHGVTVTEVAAFLSQILLILSTNTDEFTHQSAVPKVFRSLLHCCTHPNIRTRQISQSSIIPVMTQTGKDIRNYVFGFFIEFVQVQGKKFTQQNSAPILRLFPLFKSVLPSVPFKEIGKFLDIAQRLISTGLAQVCVNSLECIEQIFSSDERKYPGRMIQATIEKFIGNAPNSVDTNPALAYMNMMTSLFVRLSRFLPKFLTCYDVVRMKYHPTFFQSTFTLFFNT